jgi:hypothetical protein
VDLQSKQIQIVKLWSNEYPTVLDSANVNIVLEDWQILRDLSKNDEAFLELTQRQRSRYKSLPSKEAKPYWWCTMMD